MATDDNDMETGGMEGEAAAPTDSNLLPRFLAILETKTGQSAATAFVDRMQALEAAGWPPAQRPIDKHLYTVAPAAYVELGIPRDGMIRTVIDMAPGNTGKYRIFAEPPEKQEPLERWIDSAAARFAFEKPRLMELAGQEPITLNNVVDLQLGSTRLNHAILNSQRAGNVPGDVDICDLTRNQLDKLAAQPNAGVGTVVELLVLRVLIQDTDRFRTYADPASGLARPSGKQDGYTPK